MGNGEALLAGCQQRLDLKKERGRHAASGLQEVRPVCVGQGKGLAVEGDDLRPATSEVLQIRPQTGLAANGPKSRHARLEFQPRAAMSLQWYAGSCQNLPIVMQMTLWRLRGVMQ